jgi:hypothetical protein
VRWGERLRPIGESDAALPPAPKSAAEMVRDYIAAKSAPLVARA